MHILDHFVEHFLTRLFEYEVVKSKLSTELSVFEPNLHLTNVMLLKEDIFFYFRHCQY